MDRAALPPRSASAREAKKGRHDYAALGFVCGLEIHQQLATGKLFCRCHGDVIDLADVEPRTEFLIRRRLHPTESELGELDPAVRAEAERGMRFLYHGISGHSCLVDADEEPPHEAEPEALEIALTMAALLEARPVDEVHWMRKIVIDGSNTTGFQRTGLVALGGHIADVPIWTLALEEDSCRKLDKDEEGYVHYTLDRLGIPLIEIATAPAIRDPEHAKETAARLGALLRATRRVRRGLGTIRQDLNVSIAEGDRVEIKGVQDLRAIIRVLDREVDRQVLLVRIRDTLKERGVDPDAVQNAPIHDVSSLFAGTESKVLKSGKRPSVHGLVLPGFAGLIGATDPDAPRLGRELAEHAKRRAGVRGIFHSDELPAYGITQSEVDAVRRSLALAAEDAFVLVSAGQLVAGRALEAVRERARAAFEGVPREVRHAQQDDSTTYLRPLPGAARMYPETDVRPCLVTAEEWDRIRTTLPETPAQSEARLIASHGLSAEIARQILAEGHLELFDEVTAQVPLAGELARLLLQILPELSGEGLATERLTAARAQELLAARAAGRYAKEAIVDVARAYLKDPAAGIDAAIGAAGAESVDEAEVRAVVARIVTEKHDLVAARGEAAMGPLMGIVMKELRGKADGALIARLLQEALRGD